MIENSLLVIGCLLLCFGPTGNWKLAIPAIILSPFLIAVEYLQALITSIITEKIDNDLTKKSGILTDYLLNIHTIHAYNLEDTLFDEMMDSMRNTDKLTNKRTWRSALGQGLSQLLPSLFMIIVLAVGSVLMVSKEASFEQVFTVMMAVYMCAQFVGINMAYMPNMKLAQKSTNNVFALLNEMNPDDACREVKTEGANGDIVFDKVEFAYPTRPEAPILKGVSFTIPKNASVAFVGHSGCGKSTIISLIQRFYKPAAGTISLNGVEVNQLNLDWYRGLLGVVNQEPVMFSGTIRENLLMGVDRAVSEEELKSVCEQALCMDFINEMPDGFETDLGATGKAVSGGQKQRLALARAILRNPAILLLDEATSALDSENQEKFLEALNGWRKSHPCTVVTVAHRLSTIVDSDIIFMCENGVVVGSGRHEELLKSCPPYADLVRGQMS
uniref:ABC family transporter ATM1 n=1 Tax=Blastocystis sp. subtype 1 (strain ATCC 50177 / NandII) TaxID=478820 RepID=I3WES0_BLAHN|nr:ABC family transporter ATM1 [Blastocystis sp. ATCC 50177/Nand II]